MGHRTDAKLLAAAAVVLCTALAAVGYLWPHLGAQAGPSLDLPFGAEEGSNNSRMFHAAWVEMLKLVTAGLVGWLVAAVHGIYHGDRPANRSLLQAAVLLCMSGALMMIIIGNSTARALGIAGGASIIRFRTPVEDPKDTIMLFLVLGLGMSLGLGAFAVCGLATISICITIVLLDRFGEARPRTVALELVATGKDFPIEHVQRVLGANVRFYEPLKVVHGDEAVMRFNVKMEPEASLTWLCNQLMAGGAAGLKSVSWDYPKKSETQ